MDVAIRPLVHHMGIDVNGCRLPGFAEPLAAHQGRWHLATKRVRIGINDRSNGRLGGKPNANVWRVTRLVTGIRRRHGVESQEDSEMVADGFGKTGV